MVTSMPTISLSGKPLTFTQLRLIGTGDATIVANEDCMRRVLAADAGSGRRDDGSLSASGADPGRARPFGAGPHLPAATIRMAIAIHVNALLKGGACASPKLVEALLGLLRVDAVPPVRRPQPADGGLMGQIVRILAGGGEAGLPPVDLSAHETLACLAADSIAVASAATALRRAAHATRLLSVIGLFSSAAAGASRESWRPASGRTGSAEAEVANWLCRKAGRMNWRDDGRLQEPPSLRMLPQMLGAAMGQLRRSADTVLDATCQADGNPPLELSISLQTCQLVLAHLARNIFNRCDILMNGGRRGLPVGLVRPGTASAGLGPAFELLGSLGTRVLALSSPLQSAGIEDEASGLPQSIERLEEQTDALLHMAALEALFAAQASDILRHDHGGPGTAVHELVRSHCDFYDFDRPLFEEIETLKDTLSQERHSDALLQRYPLCPFDDVFDLAAGTQASTWEPLPARNGPEGAPACLREDTDIETLLSWSATGLVH